MKTVKAGILGATSYTGCELVRILARHPSATIAFVASRSHAGKSCCAVFPELTGVCDTTLLSPDKAKGQDADCVFPSRLPYDMPGLKEKGYTSQDSSQIGFKSPSAALSQDEGIHYEHQIDD